MESLILASHGLFCVELKKSVEMIMGPQEEIYTVPFLPDEGEEQFLKKLDEAISKINGKITVFVDLLGGSPCNFITKRIMQGENINLYAGMSMPMIISYLNACMLESEFTLTDTLAGIVKVNDILVDDEEE